MRFAVVLLLAFLGSLPAVAQLLQFGRRTPLTNTRYGPVEGSPTLISNGEEAFLLTSSSGNVWIAKLVEGLPRARRLISRGSWGPVDAVWTGTHFLLAASTDRGIEGLLLDRNGEPVGTSFRIVASAARPNLAWNGTTALMLFNAEWSYQAAPPVRAIALNANGQPVRPSELVASSATSHAVATNGVSFAAVATSATAVAFTTFNASGAVRATSIRNGLERADRQAAIASNGSEYLAVWSTASGRVSACTLVPDAPTTEPVVVEETGLNETGAPSLVWDGARYLLSYRTGVESAVRMLALDETIRTAYVDAADARRFTSTAALAIGSRTLVAWVARDSTLRLRDSADPGGEPVSASYGAVSQELVATATSAQGTLFVWREWLGGYTLHAGIRTAAGGWSERPILINADGNVSVIAASDGEEFMVIAADKSGRVAIRLSVNGRVLGVPARFTRSDVYPQSVVWTGLRYVIAGTHVSSNFLYKSTIFVAPLDPSGNLGSVAFVPPALFEGNAWNAHLASDGNGFMLAWLETEPIYCSGGYCGPEEPRSIVAMRRFGASAEILDQSPLLRLGPDTSPYPAGLFWTGFEYILGWGSDKEELRIGRFSADGQQIAPPTVVNANAWITGVTPSGLALVTWGEPETELTAITTFDRGHIAPAAVLHDAAVWSRVVPLADDRIAVVGNVPQFGEPHQGASRLLMAIGAFSRPGAEPAAPSLAGRMNGRDVILEWNEATPGVNGYRIEYRLPGGSWNELDRWLSADTTRTTVRLPVETTQASFRMRAWSDGGTSAYSNAVMVGGSARRRAVR